ncbi:uncharacterized protein LOC133304417 [Gastrolobium bilobum]|uniref:uncharacterized protein LOC133304417 n=1 Tax=Gastrolobium bilobum TaxID=150636 RepID=UPI002AB3262C|nr:uncharacterized protein LOC133304417 [Gastrolobium bilobum]
MLTNEPEPQAFTGMMKNGKASVSFEWWLENVATYHTTNDKNLLIKVIEVKDTVENCSGDETDVTHVGTANFVLSSKSAEDSAANRFLDLSSNAVIESRDAEFFENKFIKDHGLSVSGSTDMIYESPIESEASPSDTYPTQLAVESVPVRLVNLPKGAKAIGCKLVVKKKLNSDGSLARYKAHFVAKGYRQQSEVDYFGVDSPVCYLSTIRILLALTSIEHYVVYEMDVKTTSG